VGRGQHCSQEKIMSILKLRKEGKTYKDIQKTPEYSAKMVSNAIKYEWKPKTVVPKSILLHPLGR